MKTGWIRIASNEWMNTRSSAFISGSEKIWKRESQNAIPSECGWIQKFSFVEPQHPLCYFLSFSLSCIQIRSTSKIDCERWIFERGAKKKFHVKMCWKNISQRWTKTFLSIDSEWLGESINRILSPWVRSESLNTEKESVREREELWEMRALESESL